MKKFPSRIRYEKTHPNITVRVNQEIYERLQELRANGQSYGDILRIGLEKQEAYNAPLRERIYELELEILEQQELLSKHGL